MMGKVKRCNVIDYLHAIAMQLQSEIGIVKVQNIIFTNLQSQKQWK